MIGLPGTGVQPIATGGRLYALVVRAAESPDATTFFTQHEHPLQLGLIVHPAGHTIPPHTHRPVARTLAGTSEVLVLRSGTCEMDIYDDHDVLVETVTLGAGDVALLLCGGHGFRMTEDTVILEVKQGPYAGPDEKRHF